MLHNKIYNEAITGDIRAAYAQRDANALRLQIKSLSLQLSGIDYTHEDYVITAARLQICLAFLDSLAGGGKTVSLIMDIINL